MTDRFVVGTGRCGSTLLTKMLDTHRDVIGLNEVFTGLDWGRRFTTDLVDGAWVADVLGTPNHVIDMVMGKGYDAEEVTYRFRPGDRGRDRREHGRWRRRGRRGTFDHGRARRRACDGGSRRRRRRPPWRRGRRGEDFLNAVLAGAASASSATRPAP